MAAARGDFLFGDDLDAVLAVIDADMLDNDEEFDAEIKGAVDKIPTVQNKPSFKCDFCSKVCISMGGMTRHLASKHPEQNTAKSSSATATIDNKQPEDILHPLDFKKFVQKSVSKLAKDECYPKEISKEFEKVNITCLDDIIPAYNIIKPLLVKFNGDAEKFLPSVYKGYAQENPYKDLSQNCGRLLSFEVANHVLVHLSGAKLNEGVIEFTYDEKLFSEKDKSLVAYLSGYVFSTFYRRIRFSTSNNTSSYHHQCLSFLIAGKCTGELPEHKYVNIRNRGGLWSVNEDVICIFTVAESYFISSTKQHTNRIDSKVIVSALMKDTWLLVNFSRLRRNSADPIKKEVALNLLEDLLTLYIRVRAFSYAKDKQQKYKI